MPSYGHLTLFSRKSGLVRCYSCLVRFCEFRYMLVWMHYMTCYMTILKVVPFGKLLIDWWRCKTVMRVGMSGKEADVNTAVKQLTGHGNRKWLPGSGEMGENKGTKAFWERVTKNSTSRRDLNKRNIGRFRDRRNVNKWLGDNYPEISYSGLVMGMEVPKRQLGLLVKRWQKFRLGNNFEKLWRETRK